jgi:glutamyl-tRNA reductase
MYLFAVGINHQTAPVAVRERVAFSDAEMPAALTELKNHAQLSEALILSTCNRTEIYAAAAHVQTAAIAEWLHANRRVDAQRVTPFLYQHLGPAVVKHLLRVSAGLESMVLGEPQILGQVKQAYLHARQASTAGPLLARLFEHGFHVAKRVRTDTLIGHSSVSVAAAAVKLASQIFADLERETVLLVGAGDTIELTARHLSERGVRRLIVANRSLERAEQLAMRFSGYAIALGALDQHLAQADIVITSTAAPEPVIRASALERALKERRRKPMCVIDLAVPRDVEPAAGALEDVYLYTVDDLAQVVQQGARDRREAAAAAGEIIDVATDHFLSWMRSLDATGVIRALRGRVELERDRALDDALSQLRCGRDPEQVLRQFAHTLSNRLVHEPSLKLREAAASGRDDTLRAAQLLFSLEVPDEP